MATSTAVVPTQEQRVVETRGLLQRAQTEIIKALPAHLRESDPKADRFRRIILSLVNAEGMEDITPRAFVKGAIRAAEIGLEPDPIFGQLFLIPYGKVLQPIIGYKGMIELARRSGQITSVRPNLVWPEDEFEYETGLNLILRHRPNLAVAHSHKDFDDPERMPICVYAVAVPRKSEDRIVSVLAPYQVFQRRARSRSFNSNKSPWKTDPGAMWLKTAVRSLSSTMPQCQQLAKALSIESDDLDVPTGPTIDAPWWEAADAPTTPVPQSPDPQPSPVPTEASGEQSAPTPAPSNGHSPQLTVSSFNTGEFQALQRDLWMGQRIKPADVPKWIETFNGTKEQAIQYAADAAVNGRPK